MLRGKDLIKETFICLNPNCSLNRVFSGSDPHARQPICTPWVSIISSLPEKDPDILNRIFLLEQNMIRVDYQRELLKSLKKVWSLKNIQWKEIVEKIFDNLTQQILSLLEDSKRVVISGWQTVVDNSCYYEKLLSLLNNYSESREYSLKLNQCVFQLNSKFSKIQPVELLVYNKIHDTMISLKAQIQKVEQIFISRPRQINIVEMKMDMEVKKEQKDLDIDKFYNFLKQQLDNPFSKIQLLANTFNIVPKGYVNKSKDITTINCFLCEKFYETQSQINKKQSKKQITYKLLNHLGTEHFQLTFTNYKIKIAKSHIQPIKYQQVLNEISRNKQLTKIQIVDRENCGANYQNYDTGKYIFQVVSKRNCNLAKGKYVIANSTQKDAADILISFLCKDIFNIRKLQITLVTNDHFGTTMREICDGFGYNLRITYKSSK